MYVYGDRERESSGVGVGGREKQYSVLFIWIQLSCTMTHKGISSWIPNVRKEDMNGALNIYPISGGINGAQ